MSKKSKEISIKISPPETVEDKQYLEKKAAEAQADLVHQSLQEAALSEGNKRKVLDQLIEEINKSFHMGL